MDFAKLTKQLREKMLLTQREFADALGVSFTTVCRWENENHEPTMKFKRKLVELCKEHNISLEDGKN